MPLKRVFFLVVVFWAFVLCSAMGFRPPTPAQSLQAIGSTEGLPETLQRALAPGSDFRPISAPKPGDWLSVHSEPGQSFDDFVRSRPHRPKGRRNKIYLQPLGEFPEDQSPSVQTLKACATSYFVMDVELLPLLSFSSLALTTRINPMTRNWQILSGDVLRFLQKGLPSDAFCILAVTMADLYPDPSWNFVFGQASLRDRVGVFSFARYDPAFYGDERGGDHQEVLLRRSCRVLVHETAHMFSLAHCIFFTCVLNGSNHLEESDSRPLFLCPVCLRKLQFSLGFDVDHRYRRLLALYQKTGFDHEAQWVADRLKRISGNQERI